MVRRYRSGWWLEIQYWDEGLTQREIAETCDVSPTTVRKQMKRFGIPTRDLEGENHPLFDEQRDEDVRERISETMEGRGISETTRERMAEAHEGAVLPEEAREKISESLEGFTRPEETRRKMSESSSGERNAQWKDGRSGRYGPGWNRARKEVNDHDEVCQQCGHDGSVSRLEVHHIVRMWRFREADGVDLRTAHDLSNLVLLCKTCHARAERGDADFESGVEDPLDGDR